MDVAMDLAGTLLNTPRERLSLHPDMLVLERSCDTDEHKEISINEVRTLKQRLSFTAGMGGWKVAILEGAELLSKEAASALLKVLESPTGKTVIVLIAERYGAVLPTIRSRAVRVSFPPPGAASEKKEFSEEQTVEFKKFFSEVSHIPYALRFKASERYAKSAGDRQALLRYAALLFHTELLECARESIVARKCCARVRALIRTDALLMHTNANPRLLLDVFLMNL